MSLTEFDFKMMRRAIALSRRGYPAPNPHVGCVIAKNGHVLGEGYHRRAGESHAEVNALRQAGPDAHGATAYVTLEPCNHTGRTGPCTVALVAAGVSRVVFACEDPNPKASGGAAELRKAGVAVLGGVLHEEASAVNEAFLFAMAQRRAYVCLKAAISLDGRIGLPNGNSKWITGDPARRAAHRLRAEMGAVMVGPRTVLMDDPQLTARFPGAPVVTRIILDPRNEVPAHQNVFDPAAPTIHVIPVGATGHSHGLALPLANGRFEPGAVLQGLFARGITSVLVEGGASTLGSFLSHANRLELFVAGKALGDGPSWLEGLCATSIENASQFRFTKVRKVGEDLHLTLYPVRV